MQIKRWKGYRVFGIDASRIILPNHAEIKAAFGDIPITNQYGQSGCYSSALFECRYDVLNHIAYQSELHPYGSYEVDLAISLLKKSAHEALGTMDLDIYDRAYGSYEFIDRPSYRNKESPPKIINFQKRNRKHVF